MNQERLGARPYSQSYLRGEIAGVETKRHHSTLMCQEHISEQRPRPTLVLSNRRTMIGQVLCQMSKLLKLEGLNEISKYPLTRWRYVVEHRIRLGMTRAQD
jgi:hypothetical protein